MREEWNEIVGIVVAKAKKNRKEKLATLKIINEQYDMKEVIYIHIY